MIKYIVLNTRDKVPSDDVRPFQNHLQS